MCDGLIEVLNHQLKDRLDIFFGVTGVVGERGVLHWSAIMYVLTDDRSLPIRLAQESYVRDTWTPQRYGSDGIP